MHCHSPRTSWQLGKTASTPFPTVYPPPCWSPTLALAVPGPCNQWFATQVSCTKGLDTRPVALSSALGLTRLQPDIHVLATYLHDRPYTPLDLPWHAPHHVTPKTNSTTHRTQTPGPYTYNVTSRQIHAMPCQMHASMHLQMHHHTDTYHTTVTICPITPNKSRQTSTVTTHHATNNLRTP